MYIYIKQCTNFQPNKSNIKILSMNYNKIDI